MISFFISFYSFIIFFILFKTNSSWLITESIKVAATDMRYFARSKFSGILVCKNKFGLMWQYIVKGHRILPLSSNELKENSGATINSSKLVNKSESNSYWLIVFGKCFSLVKFKARSHDIFFPWSFVLLLINSSKYLLLGVSKKYCI